MTPIIIAGALVGLGVALLANYLTPAQPELASALDRLDPDRHKPGRPQPAAAVKPDLTDRLGVFVQRRLPTNWVRIPSAELNLLGISTARFLGQKAVYAVIGLLFPALFTTVIGALGITLPFSVPVIGGLVLALGLSLVPDLEVRANAATAREEFSRAVSAYIDLTALEKHAGGGTSQALELAAQVGDSWAFVRIREELGRAKWSGEPPWDALGSLGDELGVPGLADLADIMRMSGEEGIAVYDALRARAASARDTLLAADHTRANQANEALAMPVGALGIIFLALIATPAILRIAFG